MDRACSSGDGSFASLLKGLRGDRRQFVAAASSLCASLLATPGLAQIGSVLLPDPLRVLKGRNWPVVVAFVEAQVEALSPGAWIDRPEEIANDLVRYVEWLDPPYQRAVNGAFTLINAYCVRQRSARFASLTPAERRRLLNQGDSGVGSRTIPLERDFVLHTAVSTLVMLTRMVMFSRDTPQRLIGAFWSDPCREQRHLARVDEPPYPDLEAEYDVVIVGSGAGGSVVAARLAERGHRVLIVEEGGWVSPDSLVQIRDDGTGKRQVVPPRTDETLIKLYRGSGVNLTGALATIAGSLGDLADPDRRRRIPPSQVVSMVQARVVGGGPYVNNAIHLPMRAETWSRWQPHLANVTFDDLRRRMAEVERDLGVNTEAVQLGAGVRGWRFAQAGKAAGEHVMPLPVSIVPGGIACGADNSVDPMGEHTGGLHPYRPRGPNSYLMRALNAPVPAQVAHGMRAIRLRIESRKPSS